jgi:hypothetical protein
MTGTIRATANDILNQVGVEIGLDPVNDPFSATDATYRQMVYLINTAGEELCQLYPWDFLRKEGEIIVNAGVDSGQYDLPDDFLYLINQTMWNRTNRRPVMGPLSPQDWQLLKGWDVTGSLTYVSYRLMDDKLQLWPEPPADLTQINYEYISRNWVLDSTTGNTYTAKCVVGADRPLFNRTLLGRMLKVKILEAKGFDTTKAQSDLNQAFQVLIARNKSAPVLNVSGNSSSFPYLNYQSLPDTGYGG